MRTVGEILKKARLEKNISHAEVEKQIKIRKKFLIALEESNWQNLPSLPYIKGFIRNYSHFLNLNGDEMVAIFRRQYLWKDNESVLPDAVTKPVNEPFIRFTPKTIVATLLTFLMLTFLLFLANQYRLYISAPSLSVEQPIEGAVISQESILVEGHTDNDAVVEINNKKIAVTSCAGSYSPAFILLFGRNL